MKNVRMTKQKFVSIIESLGFYQEIVEYYEYESHEHTHTDTHLHNDGHRPMAHCWCACQKVDARKLMARKQFSGGHCHPFAYIPQPYVVLYVHVENVVYNLFPFHV